MKVKAIPTVEAEAALGPADEQDFTFLLVPMATYQVVHEQARKEGCGVAEVFQRAILQYLRSANDVEEEKPISVAASLPEPAIVVRRKSRT